jgi:hypothetical protein
VLYKKVDVKRDRQGVSLFLKLKGKKPEMIFHPGFLPFFIIYSSVDTFIFLPANKKGAIKLHLA